jgi:UDP-glucose 4-epimerase
VVAIFAERLLSGQPCTIYGDGEQTRDFVYVGDVAEAFLAAAERGNGQLLNIGTGVETSVNHLYSSMAAAAGGPGEPVREPERLGELKRSALSSARATTELGWCSTTSLEEGLSATLDWFANR